MAIDREREPLRGNRPWPSIHTGVLVAVTGVAYSACLFLGLALFFMCECPNGKDLPCRPSVSDVEHPGGAKTECKPGVETFRRGIILTAVFVRVIISQLTLPRVFSSLKGDRPDAAGRGGACAECACFAPGGPTPTLQWIFFILVTLGNALDVLQVFIPNDDELWYVHVFCAQAYVFCLISTSFIFLIYLGRDSEARLAATLFGWVFLAIIFLLGAFLVIFLTKDWGEWSLAWWVAEWVLVACFALLSISIGAAIPSTIRVYMAQPESDSCCCVSVARVDDKGMEEE